MEKHIFKFGSSSLALIIPKKWTEKNGLKQSSCIKLDENEHGELVLSANSEKKEKKVLVINSKLDPDTVARWVGMHYMYGIGKITLKSTDTITKKQIEEIENE